MDRFDERFDFFIHIDKRVTFPPDAVAEITSHPRCRLFSQRYINRWCGINHFLAMVYLAKEALKVMPYDYLHVQSGQDYPIRNANEINDFFERQRGSEFVEWMPLINDVWGGEAVHDRYRIYRLNTFLDVKKVWIGKIAWWIHEIQRKIGIHRIPPKTFPAMYGGSLWVSFTGDMWNYIINEWNVHPEWEGFFKFVFGPEEIILPSLALASPFREKVIQKGVNYVEWILRNGSRPANLDISDFTKISGSDFLFARKMEYPLSESLLDRIDKELLRVG